MIISRHYFSTRHQKQEDDLKYATAIHKSSLCGVFVYDDNLHVQEAVKTCTPVVGDIDGGITGRPRTRPSVSHVVGDIDGV